MSYDLEFYFEPAIRRTRILEYFAARKHFEVENDTLLFDSFSPNNFDITIVYDGAESFDFFRFL
jgi:hypothetical protein